MADYGLLTEVISQSRSAALASDAAVSATELEVDDAGDFNASSDQEPDGGGGTLLLNGVQLEYTDITWGETEDDTDLILLADPLAVAAGEGDAVIVIVGGQPAEDWYAVVDMGEGDNAHVPLTFAQRAQWALGIYEPTPVQVSDDLELIEDAPGRPPSAGTRVAFKIDTFTVAEPGEQTNTLSFVPLSDSLHVYWTPLEVPEDRITISGQTVTVSDDDNRLRAGDTLGFWYAYDPAADALVASDPGGGLLIDFESAGGKWKQVARTDATDYSSPSFDDSSWSAAVGAFGASTPSGYISGLTDWPTESTGWTQTTRMWLRRTFSATAGVDLKITIRLNRMVSVWLNGTLVVPDTEQATRSATYTIPGSNVLASNKIAIRATDDTFTGSHTGCYFDYRVEQ